MRQQYCEEHYDAEITKHPAYCELCKLKARIKELEEAASALLDDIGDTYDGSSGYHRIQVWVDGNLIDELQSLLDKQESARPTPATSDN